MEDLLKEMMNRGFMIFESGAKFVLKKSGTPFDGRVYIMDDSSMMSHDSFNEALDSAKDLIGWNPKPVDRPWVMQMMYNHPTGPQFIDLGEISQVSYEDAVKEASVRADRYIDEFSENNISKHEVRVRPA